ncbi:MAG: choice-of-anchor Q domain-containing protein [Candidatus Bipolaricaulota bacterium]
MTRRAMTLCVAVAAFVLGSGGPCVGETRTVTSAADAGAGTLRQVIADAAAGDRIRFTLPTPTTITLTSGELVVDKDLTIDGPGDAALTVDGGAARRAFFVVAGVEASISGLTVARGRDPGADAGGGGIRNDGTLTLEDCTVTACWAEFLGGGIYNTGTLTLRRCTLDDNEAGGWGGGLDNDVGATATLVDCTVRANRATLALAEGGGISNYGTLDVLDSRVCDNIAQGSGGGVENDGTLALTRCTIEGNRVVEDQAFGAGIANYDGTATATDCTIEGNRADGPWSEGGGVGNADGDMTLLRCTVRNNASDVDGGGIANFGTLLAEDCLVEGNVVSDFGGGLYNEADEPGEEATLLGCTIRGNTSSVDAVAGDSEGGGICNYGALTARNCTICENVADLLGGGIENDGELTLVGCTLRDNRLTAAGGWGAGVCNWLGVVSATHCTVSGNQGEGADSEGGGFTVSGGRVDLVYCTIAQNSATLRGGGVFVESGTVRAKATILAGNEAPAGPEAFGEITSHGDNLIEDPSDCVVLGDVAGNLLGVDPQLSELGDHGGETETHALERGSPALDAAGCTDLDGDAVTRDQRGVTRPQGARCDIGAYERSQALPPIGTGCGENRPPVPCAGPDQQSTVGERVVLDGQASYDPDEGIPPGQIMSGTPRYVHQNREDLKFRWEVATLYYAAGVPVLAQPHGADVAASAEGFDTAVASFVPDVPGVYALDLFVTDDFGETMSDRVTITCAPREDGELPPEIPSPFWFERFLVWPNPSADLVHFGFEGQGTASLRVVVVDLAGRAIWEEQASGVAELTWDGCLGGERLAAGAYIYVIALAADGQERRETGVLFLSH